MAATKQAARLKEFLEHGLFGELGVPALVVSLVLFVSAMTLLGANVSEIRAGYGRVQQTNAALLEIAMVNSDILRVEMTVRGYALSGDGSYLGWLKESRDIVRGRIQSLEKMVSGDPEQRADIAILKKLIAEHGAYFDGMAKRVTTEREKVIAEMVDYSKKVKRRPIENMLLDMREDQMKLLAGEQREAERRVVNAYIYGIGISSLALLFGALGFALILHDQRKPRRTFV
jgi:CHASE3 domain sensor protein